MFFVRLIGLAAAVSMTAPVAAQQPAVSVSAPPAAQQPAVFGVTPFGAVTVFRSKLPAVFHVLGRQVDPEVENGSLETAGAWGSGISVRLNGRYGIEAVVAQASATLTSTNRDSFSVDYYMFSANGSYYLQLFGAGREIFIGAGGGLKLYDWMLDSTKAETDWGWNVGGGISVAIMSRLALRLEARDFMTSFGSRMSGSESVLQHDVLVTAGLTLSVVNER